MKKLADFFSIVLSLFWQLVPWKMNRVFGKILSFIWIDLFNIRSKVIYENLDIVFPNMSHDEKRRIAKASMKNLCASFFDVIKIPYLNSNWIDQNVVFENPTVFEKMKSEESGFFILTLHLGSGDLAAAVVSEKIRRTSLITKRFRSVFLDSLWFGFRTRSKTKFIDAHASNNAFDILKALKNGDAVAFVLDQFMGMPYGVETQFFGKTTGTAYGLALFAKKTKKPVYPLFNYWSDDGKFHVCALDAIDLSQELSENNEIVTNKFNKVLEGIIAKYPEHWMWVHRRWKTFE